jgi:hypothetical protein
MVDPMTEHATDHFTATVYPSGPLSLACKPIDRHPVITGDGGVGFDLPEGTTTERLRGSPGC